MHTAKLLPLALLLLLVGCGAEDREPAPKRSRTAVTTLPANICPVVARSASPELELREHKHNGATAGANPAYSSCTLLGMPAAGISTDREAEVVVGADLWVFGDQAGDLAADRVDEEVERQCAELAQEHPETERAEDGTCSYHATAEVSSGSSAMVSTATAVVRLPKVHGVAGIDVRIEGEDAGRSRTEALAIGQRLTAADLED